MTFLRTLRVLFPALAACLLAGVAQAQLSTTLALSKRQYLAGEPILATVTITNHAGVELTFYGDGRTQWLDFVLKDSQGDAIPGKPGRSFGKLIIKAGQTLARQVDLGEHFYLGEPGNFSATAVIHMPANREESSSTNRVTFNLSPGSPYWNQKVGIPGKNGMTREFRLVNFSGDEKTQVYAKVIDGRTGQNVRTFLLGDVMMMRKPVATVDRNQRMHVLFLASPTMWVHCQIDTDGKLVDRKIHQRGDQGDPKLVSFPDGTVGVSNSIIYDQKAEAEARSKIRKATDRPPVNF